MNITMDSAKALIESQARKHELEEAQKQRIAPSHTQIPQHYKDVASYVFEQMTTMRPGWKVGFMNQDKSIDQKRITSYKLQLLKAMQSNSIDNFEKVEFGLDKLRSESGQFLPSVGDFIQACKTEKSGELNSAMYREYRPEKLIASCTEEERKKIAKENLAKLKGLINDK